MGSLTNHIPAKDTPSALNFFFTGRCNLNCRYCFVDKTGLEKVTADEASLRRSVDILLAYPGQIKRISFKGGEPLLEFAKVRAVCDYARRAARQRRVSLELSVVTNGTLLDRKKADYFARQDVYVEVSIDGTRAAHDQNRRFKSSPGGSSFDRIIANIDRIKPGSVQLGASMVFTPGTVARLADNIKFLNKRDFRYIDFYPDLFAAWTAADLRTAQRNFLRFRDYYVALFTGRGRVFKNHIVDKFVNGSATEKVDCCQEVHLSPRKEFYLCDKVFSLEPSRRKKYVVGNAARGIDEPKREKMLGRLRKDFAARAGLDCAGCLFRAYCFCPVGHQIYAENLKAGRQEKQAAGFYRSFCSFSKIYSAAFWEIKLALRHNPRFEALYFSPRSG